MLIRIGLENNPRGRSLAWALDFPGAFAYGKDGSEAILRLPQGLARYEHWANTHAGANFVELGDFDLRLVDTWQVYTIGKDMLESEDGYEVDAWFRDDWRPLGEDDVQRGMMLCRWSRGDLLAVTSELPAEKLDQTYPEQRWSIRGILAHVANAEWWYLDRLGLAQPRESLSKDVFERLAAVRARVEESMPGLVGSRKVVGVDGEFWSPRKLLRRILWHEMDHIGHIIELL